MWKLGRWGIALPRPSGSASPWKQSPGCGGLAQAIPSRPGPPCQAGDGGSPAEITAWQGPLSSGQSKRDLNLT